MENSIDFPNPPQISSQELELCRQSGDYCPILFEWYKYVGLVANFFASIRLDSPAIRPIPDRQYNVLIGLLNRCSRLMLSNVALSHEGLFGETTAIIDRCIFESAIKLQWLCKTRSDAGFSRFIADGLKTELEFKDSIEKFIKERNGESLHIEKRMLESIGRAIAESGFTEAQIRATPKLSNLADLIRDLGEHRIVYVVGQKIGSHHVHGTWPSLRMHYLVERDEGLLGPRDHDCQTHVNQYVFIPRIVLDALIAFADYICCDAGDSDSMKNVVTLVGAEIDRLNSEVIGTDFELVTNI